MTTFNQDTDSGAVINHSIHGEQLKLVLSMLNASVVTSVLIASIVVLVLWSSVEHTYLVAWHFMLTSISLLRLITATRLRIGLDHIDVSETKRRIKFFSAITVAASALWGVAPFLVFPGDDFENQLFIVIVLTGISAGALSSLSATFSLIRLYIIFALSPLMFLLLAQQHTISIAIGAMVLLYMFAIITNARRVNTNITDNIVLRYKGEMREKELEKLRLEAEKANRTKSEFLANMSHELRTPMNGILGASHLLGMTPLNNEQHEYVTTIDNSGNSLLTLLNDLLDFSKIEAGKMDLDLTVCDLDGIIKHLQHLLATQASDKGIDFSLSRNDEVARYIICDQQRLTQILINLLGNAIKFTDQGEVSLQVRLTNDNKNLHFSVTDSGIGIPVEKQKMLFNKFQQMESSTSRKYGGTGLGLAISKQLITLMDGTIGVESKIGKGSRFWFIIPFKKATTAEIERLTNKTDMHSIETGDDSSDSIHTYHILLAEDNKINRTIAQRILTKLGYTHVDVVENGNQAIERLLNNDYDLVLMDVQMPECDGLEATRRIRSADHSDSGRNHNIPIIALTANAMESDIQMCLEAGMNAHIGKPINISELQHTVTYWLHRTSTNNISSQPGN